MIQGKFISEPREQEAANEIFCEVYGESIQNTPKHDTSDKSYKIQAVVYEGMDCRRAVAAGTMYMEPGRSEITQVAVRKDSRGKGYGDFIMRMLLDKAKTAGAENIYADSPKTEKGFFRKLGFEETQEEIRDDTRIWTIMKYIPDNSKKYCSQIKIV